MTIERCAGCGLEVEGGTEGCHAIFEEMVGRDFSDVRYGRTHRFLVDAYCLQHPDRYCVSAESLAAHLCAMCQSIERGGSRAEINERLRRWLDGPGRMAKPDLPPSRGSLTIASVRDAADPEAHAAAVERWAADIWSAYAPLHRIARTWLDEAMAAPNARR